MLRLDETLLLLLLAGRCSDRYWLRLAAESGWWALRDAGSGCALAD